MKAINNLPDYAKNIAFIVVRECDNEYWFWGAYEDRKTACKAAEEIDGIVIRNVEA